MTKITKNQTLINFIVPDELIEDFDNVCQAKSQTRTSILKRLMDEFVNENSYLMTSESLNRIRTKNKPFKFGLTNKSEPQHRRQLLTFKEHVNQKLKDSAPIDIIKGEPDDDC